MYKPRPDEKTATTRRSRGLTLWVRTSPDTDPDGRDIYTHKKTSAFAGLIGKRVASEKCTVVDNGTMPWRRGSLNVDDEGQPTQETVLIENGILKGYLSDKLSSKLMGLADTGTDPAARAISPLSLPIRVSGFLPGGSSWGAFHGGSVAPRIGPSGARPEAERRSALHLIWVSFLPHRQAHQYPHAVGKVANNLADRFRKLFGSGAERR